MQLDANPIPHPPSPSRVFLRDTSFTVALVLVTVAALGLRLYHLDAQSLYMDEFWQVGSYSMPVSYVLSRAADQGYPPLDYLIGMGLDRLRLAESDWWVRFPAALFGAGGVLLFGLWMKRVGGAFVGIMAAALLAICPLNVFMSQEARPYTIFVFLGIATILSFSRARHVNSFGSWILYGFTLMLMLLTRWDGPHLILGMLAVYAVGMCVRARYFSMAGREEVERENRLLRSAFIASLIAVACQNPVLGVILEYNRHSVGAEPGQFLTTATETLSHAYAALIHGYSAVTIRPVDGPVSLLYAGAILSVVGLVTMIRSARRRTNQDQSLFLLAAVPFPILYAVTFAALSSFPPKPQYLLFLSIPLFGTIAYGLGAIRRSLMNVDRRAAMAVAVALGLVIAVPMAQASLIVVTTEQRRDWRGVYAYLRANADEHDAFASVGSQTLPVNHQPVAPGTERYLRMPVRFAKIGPDTTPGELNAPVWSDETNTVWLLCYTNRLYEPADLVPPPEQLPPGLRTHTFHGLFLIEAAPGAPALDRLADAFAALYRDLPDNRSLLAPAAFLQKYYAARGDGDQTLYWKHKALAQCRPEDKTELLVSMFADVAPTGITQAHMGDANEPPVRSLERRRESQQ